MANEESKSPVLVQSGASLHCLWLASCLHQTCFLVLSCKGQLLMTAVLSLERNRSLFNSEVHKQPGVCAFQKLVSLLCLLWPPVYCRIPEINKHLGFNNHPWVLLACG